MTHVSEIKSLWKGFFVDVVMFEHNKKLPCALSRQRSFTANVRVEFAAFQFVVYNTVAAPNFANS